MLTRLDHLVILVSDLDPAVVDYEPLGFAVTAGGEHADGLTRNARPSSSGYSPHDESGGQASPVGRPSPASPEACSLMPGRVRPPTAHPRGA